MDNNCSVIEQVIEFIYQKWFPESSYTFDDKVKLDLIRYGTEKGKDGLSDIEVFVPIL